MKYNALSALFLIYFPLSLYSAEPSAFGAGDLSSPNPYGLTSSEEVVLETKKKLDSVVVTSNNQANRVDSLRERIDGLQSIVEGLSLKTYEVKKDLQTLNEANKNQLKNNDELGIRLSEITNTNTQNIEKLNIVIAELTSVVDTINSSYVSKEEFNALVSDINRFKDLVAKELKNTPSNTKKDDSFRNKTSAEVYNEAKQSFDKKLYNDALKSYSYLIEKNYKPAYAHYMIGVIHYDRKHYADAIAYFKKSSTLYSKASYMPELLLYTAISMDNTGDKTNAKNFYNVVIQKYPDSNEAKTAKKQLSLMK
ncbi:MAG: tetratricopeptide repeat protein [Sulfurimonadaceae bacterium]|jgi:TolA-binding protein|nr:tetratricopeptide repeat protein [Sulfurimonadaceae bacterium]